MCYWIYSFRVLMSLEFGSGLRWREKKEDRDGERRIGFMVIFYNSEREGREGDQRKALIAGRRLFKYFVYLKERGCVLCRVLFRVFDMKEIESKFLLYFRSKMIVYFLNSECYKIGWN